MTTKTFELDSDRTDSPPALGTTESDRRTRRGLGGYPGERSETSVESRCLTVSVDMMAADDPNTRPTELLHSRLAIALSILEGRRPLQEETKLSYDCYKFIRLFCIYSHFHFLLLPSTLTVSCCKFSKIPRSYRGTKKKAIATKILELKRKLELVVKFNLELNH